MSTERHPAFPCARPGAPSEAERTPAGTAPFRGILDGVEGQQEAVPYRLRCPWCAREWDSMDVPDAWEHCPFCSGSFSYSPAIDVGAERTRADVRRCAHCKSQRTGQFMLYWPDGRAAHPACCVACWKAAAVRNRRVAEVERALTHNHGYDPGCRETRTPDGRLQGECMDRYAPRLVVCDCGRPYGPHVGDCPAAPPSPDPLVEWPTDSLAGPDPDPGQWASEDALDALRTRVAEMEDALRSGLQLAEWVIEDSDRQRGSVSGRAVQFAHRARTLLP